jgi:hypothetical protein
VTEDGDPEKVQSIMEAAAAAAAAAVGVDVPGAGTAAPVGAGEGVGGGDVAHYGGAGSLGALQEAVVSVNKWSPAAVHGKAPVPRCVRLLWSDVSKTLVCILHNHYGRRSDYKRLRSSHNLLQFEVFGSNHGLSRVTVTVIIWESIYT